MSSRNPFTCITCRVAFAASELQREHYKTDWHRYNLKRKVAELPPVTAEAFNEKVAEKQKVEPVKQGQFCTICRKKYKSENSYKSHLQTRQHRLLSESSEKQDLEEKEKDSEQTEQVTSTQPATDLRQAVVTTQETPMQDDDSDVESWCSEDGIGLEECLFCSHVSIDIDANVQHMASSHSFFIPHTEFVSDLDGLLSYLGQKVGCGHMCLWCGDRSKAFRSTRAAQQHMKDLGHCKIEYDGDAVFEYSDFYDYTSSYPETEEESEMEVDNVLDTSGFELVLPSGASVGHRSLHKFYKQNVPAVYRSRRSNVSRVLAQYRAIGWTGTTGEQARRAARDMSYVKRFHAHQRLRLNIKANKMQHHFRQQNPI